MKPLKVCVLAAVAALVATSCSFIGAPSGHRIVAYFRDVGDLVERSTIRINDIEAGTVDDITLVTRDGQMLARVTMSLDREVRLSAQDLHAVIRQTSLLGEQFVELVPSGSGPPYVGTSETTILESNTDKRVDVETFLADLSTLVGSGTIEDLNRFTHAQALILQNRGDRLGETLSQLRRFTDVLAGRGADIGAAIDNLASTSQTIASNQATLDSFLDSLDEANALLADQGDDLGDLFRALSRFGEFNAQFLARHEKSITRNFKALRPVLAGLSGASDELRVDIDQLNTFFALFSDSIGGGPGSTDFGDYIQADAVLCEQLARCHTKGEKGDVPGEGS